MESEYQLEPRIQIIHIIKRHFSRNQLREILINGISKKIEGRRGNILSIKILPHYIGDHCYEVIVTKTNGEIYSMYMRRQELE